jgi:serine/threonine-protein kinase
MGAPAQDDALAIGSVLDGRYRIDAILGAGGMGRVYKGEHTSLGRTVAIKVLHADLGRNKEATSRFQREAMAYGRLDHPNIVGVSDFGVLEDGALYLVMEALEGESLGERLTRERRVPWVEAVNIMRGILSGLRHAHDRGVVHRDIKPDNIFLARKDEDVVIKILDFGIAKLYAGSADDPATTRAGLTVGTPAYLSPEQAVGGSITPASDLYSASIVLYEMLAGRAPYEDKEPLAMLTAHVSREPPWFRDVAADVELPPHLEEVMRKGLVKVSAERTSSALDYIQMLDDVLRGAGIEVAPMARASTSMAIPIGPHAPISTPPPGSLMATPSFLSTPMPFEVDPSLLAVAPTATAMTPPPIEPKKLPPAARMVSIADLSDPIPRRWIVIATLCVIAAVVGAIALLATRDRSSNRTPDPGPLVLSTGGDRDTRLKAALHDLESGKTCADRKAAIPALVDLHDERAIPDLKRARFRMRGGVLGVGDSNTNGCLRADAEAAIKALGGTLK